MKRLSIAASVALLFAVGAMAIADHHEEGDHKHQDGKAWFDAEHCTICQPMAKNPELMMSMQWETHKIENGMLMMSTVPEGKQKKFEKVCTQMKEVAEKVAKGEKPDAVCCGFCTAFGKAMQAGANEQRIKTKSGAITLLTAQSPETVDMLHKMADRTIEEAKKFEAMKQF